MNATVCPYIETGDTVAEGASRSRVRQRIPDGLPLQKDAPS